MEFITLLTDFGLQDGYPGVMKGVIYRITPDVQITDISHLVHPQNILEGSLVWKRSVVFFPEKAIHVGVVDPGVGTQRRPIAARLGETMFVCPDNGLLTPLLEEAEKNGKTVQVVHLDRPEYWLPQVSSVFHGRDIFAPAAAHLARGVPLTDLGTLIQDPVRFHPPEPRFQENTWYGEVISIDHFGNLITNLLPGHLEQLENLQVRVGGREIDVLVETFGSRMPGELVALIDSDGNLSIAVVNGNAAHLLDVDLGEPVEVAGTI